MRTRHPAFPVVQNRRERVRVRGGKLLCAWLAALSMVGFIGCDFDRDGMGDLWEILFDLNPADPEDRFLDPDTDGLTNIEEFLLKLSPRDMDTDRDGVVDAYDLEQPLALLDEGQINRIIELAEEADNAFILSVEGAAASQAVGLQVDYSDLTFPQIVQVRAVRSNCLMKDVPSLQDRRQLPLYQSWSSGDLTVPRQVDLLLEGYPLVPKLFGIAEESRVTQLRLPVAQAISNVEYEIDLLFRDPATERTVTRLNWEGLAAYDLIEPDVFDEDSCDIPEDEDSKETFLGYTRNVIHPYNPYGVRECFDDTTGKPISYDLTRLSVFGDERIWEIAGRIFTEKYIMPHVSSALGVPKFYLMTNNEAGTLDSSDLRLNGPAGEKDKWQSWTGVYCFADKTRTDSAADTFSFYETNADNELYKYGQLHTHFHNRIYGAFRKSMETLISEPLAARLRIVPYNGFKLFYAGGTSGYARLSPHYDENGNFIFAGTQTLWDGTTDGKYFTTDTTWDDNSPHYWIANAVFPHERVFNGKSPQEFFWITHHKGSMDRTDTPGFRNVYRNGSFQKLYEKDLGSQAYADYYPRRFRGLVNFALWMLRPDKISEYLQNSADTGWDRPLVEFLVDPVDHRLIFCDSNDIELPLNTSGTIYHAPRYDGNGFYTMITHADETEELIPVDLPPNVPVPEVYFGHVQKGGEKLEKTFYRWNEAGGPEIVLEEDIPEYVFHSDFYDYDNGGVRPGYSPMRIRRYYPELTRGKMTTDGIVKALRAVHENAVLRSFWLDSSLVPNHGPDGDYEFPMKTSGVENVLPADLMQEKRKAVYFLDTNYPPEATSSSGEYTEGDAVWNPKHWIMPSTAPNGDWSSPLEMTVFAFARTRMGESGQEWLVYAHAPRKPEKDVSIYVPIGENGERVRLIVDVPVEGAFYFFDGSHLTHLLPGVDERQLPYSGRVFPRMIQN